MVSSLSFSSPAPFFAVKSLTLILIGTNWERSSLLLLPSSLRSIIRNTRGAISDCLPITVIYSSILLVFFKNLVVQHCSPILKCCTRVLLLELGRH
ncbi:hypothetical protein RchiOBHm_Chr4g0442501 [Rosa chinensis]|uniref:Uncharacterized protein n=1 Tax=Rosa chinensis TaxID=74649 RepID=A0A2P6R3M5_ROSCH|nr:hypothetical protein RchiOBHm_Chr4g0442501 [Rosa chinensis]